jgi:hypothetical protein
MAEESSNLIRWNPANWITVVLMVGLAYFLLGAGVRIMRERSGAKAGA